MPHHWSGREARARRPVVVPMQRRTTVPAPHLIVEMQPTMRRRQSVIAIGPPEAMRRALVTPPWPKAGRHPNAWRHVRRRQRALPAVAAALQSGSSRRSSSRRQTHSQHGCKAYQQAGEAGCITGSNAPEQAPGAPAPAAGRGGRCGGRLCPGPCSIGIDAQSGMSKLPAAGAEQAIKCALLDRSGSGRGL